MVPNVPDDVQIQLDRTEFLASRVIEGEEDNDDDDDTVDAGSHVPIEFQTYEYSVSDCQLVASDVEVAATEKN